MSQQTAVAMREEEAAPTVVSETAAILSVIERAARDPNVDIDKLDRLLAMRERMEARAAAREFDGAVAKAKADLPPIIKNRKGHNDKRYADFAALARVVDPIITSHGLSYRFRTKQDERIHVTCVLTHSGGHSEETTLSGPADTSGSKNAIQAIGSTLTYLQRYSLTQALGLAASEDDDGKAAGASETITDEQAKFINAALDEVGADKAAFCRFMGVDSIPEIRDYQKAMLAVEQKRRASAKPK